MPRTPVRAVPSSPRLSRLAAELAAEISGHDWSDAPFRADRAGHDRATDSKAPARVLTPDETDTVRLNAMWVTAQVLAHADPNFDVVAFAAACGCAESRPGVLRAGLRSTADGVAAPGTAATTTHLPEVAAYQQAIGTAAELAQQIQEVADEADRLKEQARSNALLRTELVLDQTLTWGDLRDFARLGDGHPDEREVGIEYDENGHDLTGLYDYVPLP